MNEKQTMWIRQVKAMHADGVESIIDFTPGLNCIIGPSNTGKTRIAKTIGYVCGGNDTPFTDKTGYREASVTFATADGEVTLMRSVSNRQIVEVRSSDPRIDSGSYAVNTRNKPSINAVLLSTMGIEPSRRIAKNEAGDTVAFTWNAIRHLLLAPEDQIGRPNPSILLPKATNPMTLTQSLSALLVLTQDEQFGNHRQTETATERRARRKAIETFVQQQLNAIQPRIKELERFKQRSGDSSISSCLSALRDEADELDRQRQDLLERDAKTIADISQLSQTIERLTVLITQRETLIGQYDADVARLDFQVQAMRQSRNQPYPDTCQFCHSPILISPPGEDDITARLSEIDHIREMRDGAEANLKVLRSQREDVIRQRDQRRQRHHADMAALKNGVASRSKTLHQRMDQLVEEQQLEAEYRELTTLRRKFDDALDNEHRSVSENDKFRPRDCFQPDFFHSMRSIIRDILQQSHFPHADSADFDKQDFDVEIAGYSKADEQGKGYCAFLNTVVMLAFHDYLNARSKHALGWLLIDTPLHGFDEGEHLVDESMRAGLFDCMARQAADQQIIVLENTDHMAGLPLDLNANVIEFTKNPNRGRYGYLIGVRDVAEEG